VASLLRRLGERYNDPAALRELYAEDAVLHDSRVRAWYKGPQAIGRFVSGRFRAPVTFTAVSYDGGADRARVAGYVTRGGAHIGHVHLSLDRGTDGQWRVGAETLTFPGPEAATPFTAEDLVRELDGAGIQRAVVLPVAYWFSASPVPVQAENDWAIAEAAKFPQRLTVFCGIPVQAAFAVAEVERCARQPGVTGVKVHLGNAGIDIRRPDHAAKVRAVFAAANRLGLAIVVHLWTTGDYEEKAGEHARAFLDQALPAAPDVPVQVAHMAGGGFSSDSALAVFAGAFAARDPRVAHLYFDVASITAAVPERALAQDAARMREIGLDRFLWGSDLASADTPLRRQWRLYRGLSPLTDVELRVLATNVAPYLRR
jgi:predicted TIM-barrel fold metal-dependent hydrolase